MAFWIEQALGAAIAVVSLALAGLSALAWRRERSRRLLLVAVAYGVFTLRGLAVFGQKYLAYLPGEIAEHASAILVFVGLLVFFAALVGE